jgi:hypothetical protein
VPDDCRLAWRLLYCWCGRARSWLDWVKAPTRTTIHHQPERITMAWTKPEAEVVAVTMEVTAYVATL